MIIYNPQGLIGPTRASSLEVGLYFGYQAELNTKARPGHVGSLGGPLTMLTMKQIPNTMKIANNIYRMLRHESRLL